MNPSSISGKPDFAFQSERVLIFVDGCFWHGCPHCNRIPTSNTGYWDGKIARNRQRDRSATEQLLVDGWKVVRIWEHELKTLDSVLERITLALLP